MTATSVPQPLRRRRASASLLAALAAGALGLSGCQPPSPTPTASITPTAAITTLDATPSATASVVTPSPTPTSAANAPVLSAEFVDRLDGSTAAIPLAQSALRALRGTDEGLTFNTTPQAYGNLIAGIKDLILVSPPSQEEFAAAQAAGIELEIVPLAKDGLVFLANTANPVSGLTSQQIKDIYTGKVTDWGQVGGKTGAIVPYQRPVGSGSQTLFLKLAMDGATPLDAPSALRPSEMAGLVNDVAAMDNGPTALGYSVFYYATQMYLKDTVKLLSVDGIAPSAQSISDGSYPFITFVNAVFRKDTPADSPVRGFVDWLRGDDAQKIASAANYVPLESRNIVDAKPVYYLDATSENTTTSSGTGGTKPRPQTPLDAAAYSCDDNAGGVSAFSVSGHDAVSRAVREWYDSKVDPTREGSGGSCWDISATADLVSVMSLGPPTSSGGAAPADGAVFDMATGRRLGLSDLFFDGVNYIKFINDNLMNQWTNQSFQDHLHLLGAADAGDVMAAPFTGIPADYGSFGLSGGELTVYFPGGNPFTVATGNPANEMATLALPLPLNLSPFGSTWRVDHLTAPGAGATYPWPLAVPTVATGFPSPRAADTAINAAIQTALRSAPGAAGSVVDQWGPRLTVTFWSASRTPYGPRGSILSMTTVDLVTGREAPLTSADIPRSWWTVPYVSVVEATLPEDAGLPQAVDGYSPPSGTTYRFVRRTWNGVAFEIVEPSGRVLEATVPA